MENPFKIDDLGYHYFWKHPYSNVDEFLQQTHCKYATIYSFDSSWNLGLEHIYIRHFFGPWSPWTVNLGQNIRKSANSESLFFWHFFWRWVGPHRVGLYHQKTQNLPKKTGWFLGNLLNKTLLHLNCVWHFLRKFSYTKLHFLTTFCLGRHFSTAHPTLGDRTS